MLEYVTYQIIGLEYFYVTLHRNKMNINLHKYILENVMKSHTKFILLYIYLFIINYYKKTQLFNINLILIQYLIYYIHYIIKNFILYLKVHYLTLNNY